MLNISLMPNDGWIEISNVIVTISNALIKQTAKVEHLHAAAPRKFTIGCCTMHNGPIQLITSSAEVISGY